MGSAGLSGDQGGKAAVFKVKNLKLKKRLFMRTLENSSQRQMQGDFGVDL